MRLRDAGLRQCQTKALYFNHRPSPWPTKDATRERFALIFYGVLGIWFHPSHALWMQLSKLLVPVPLCLVGGWVRLRFARGVPDHA